MAKREIELEVMVRLTAEEKDQFKILQAEYPGRRNSEVFRDLMRDFTPPRDVTLRYRLPPGHKSHKLFPEWRTWGTFNPIGALHRGEKLLRDGWEVETVPADNDSDGDSEGGGG